MMPETVAKHEKNRPMLTKFVVLHRIAALSGVQCSRHRRTDFGAKLYQKLSNADEQHSCQKAPDASDAKVKRAGARRLSAEARRVHACVHHDAEKAEFGSTKSRQGATHQRL